LLSSKLEERASPRARGRWQAGNCLRACLWGCCGALGSGGCCGPAWCGWGLEPHTGHGGILSGRLVADLAGLALADDDDGGHRGRTGAMGRLLRPHRLARVVTNARCALAG